MDDCSEASYTLPLDFEDQPHVGYETLYRAVEGDRQALSALLEQHGHVEGQLGADDHRHRAASSFPSGVGENSSDLGKVIPAQCQLAERKIETYPIASCTLGRQRCKKLLKIGVTDLSNAHRLGMFTSSTDRPTYGHRGTRRTSVQCYCRYTLPEEIPVNESSVRRSGRNEYTHTGKQGAVCAKKSSTH